MVIEVTSALRNLERNAWLDQRIVSFRFMAKQCMSELLERSSADSRSATVSKTSRSSLPGTKNPNSRRGHPRLVVRTQRTQRLNEEKENRRWTTMEDDAFRLGTLTQQVKGWLRVSRFLPPWSFICGSIAVFRFTSAFFFAPRNPGAQRGSLDRLDFLRPDASFTGSAPQRYRIVSHTSDIVVSKLP